MVEKKELDKKKKLSSVEPRTRTLFDRLYMFPRVQKTSLNGVVYR